MLNLIQQRLQSHSKQLEQKIIQHLGPKEFTLYEDILIIEKMLTDQLKYSDFVELSKMCNQKQPEQLKLRYISLWKYLTEDDLKEIGQFIEKYGLEGQATYEKNKFHINQLQFGNTKKAQRVQRVDNQPPITKKRKIIPENQPMPQNYYQLTDFQKHIIYSQVQVYQEQRFPTNPNFSQIQRLEQEQFQNYLDDLSIWYDIPNTKMIQLLYSCSGNFNNLRQFLEDKNFYIYWKPEDDELLQSGDNLNSLFITKGVTEVEKRKQWLGL